ncbi:hypothetical protein [Paenibacillus sp. Soil787]|uniref:hypothetical protein n=1 Tax=Paenibacillus sp. Soil787 TaxID=1736411 RepID=UPI0006FB2051|nr:hypothetical protein [Paenibacillus sp. Soil787]KRF31690.1 hypothetical protein ASG93_04965 [Paenibacillus sp. Soil787]
MEIVQAQANSNQGVQDIAETVAPGILDAPLIGRWIRIWQETLDPKWLLRVKVKVACVQIRHIGSIIKDIEKRMLIL